MQRCPSPREHPGLGFVEDFGGVSSIRLICDIWRKEDLVLALGLCSKLLELPRWFLAPSKKPNRLFVEAEAPAGSILAWGLSTGGVRSATEATSAARPNRRQLAVQGSRFLKKEAPGVPASPLTADSVTRRALGCETRTNPRPEHTGFPLSQSLLIPTGARRPL